MIVHQLSECHIDWADEVKQAQTKEQLLEVCNKFEGLALDALATVSRMTDLEFSNNWLPGFRMEQKNISAGTAWNRVYGCVMYPDVIAKVGLYCLKANIPFGLAYEIMISRGGIKCTVPYSGIDNLAVEP